MAECNYCDHEATEVSDPSPTPAANDDAAWKEIAKHHDKDCEWVLTRAHQREMPQPIQE